MREKWTNFSGIAVNHTEKERNWIRFRRLLLRDMAFILPILKKRIQTRGEGIVLVTYGNR
jgi:hypothetical protein